MKKIKVLAATAIVALGIAATSCDSKPSANLKSAVDSASYAIGVSTGAGYKRKFENITWWRSQYRCTDRRFCFRLLKVILQR